MSKIIEEIRSILNILEVKIFQLEKENKKLKKQIQRLYDEVKPKDE